MASKVLKYSVVPVFPWCSTIMQHMQAVSRLVSLKMSILISMIFSILLLMFDSSINLEKVHLKKSHVYPVLLTL